ncbi:MAG: F0F1 ATP synthase subunit epsilon [Anaerolineaceae bacterium]|nr:F0F1 ATP synthase subunit epsilon [Anaerolineaceae bacterium]
MAEPLALRVWSPSETLLNVDDVSKVIVSLGDGLIGILPGHTNLLAESADGEIRYTDNNGEEYKMDLFGGILKVENNQVLLFTSGVREENSELLKPAQIEEELKFDRLALELMEVMKIGPR